jgi:hypothetical protein
MKKGLLPVAFLTGCATIGSLLALAVAPAGAQVTGGLSAPYPQDERLSQVVAGVSAILQGRIAIAPDEAPEKVKRAIAWANKITDKPYVYGGGHKGWKMDKGYDCSGTISYALRGAGMIERPRDSGSFMRYGMPGRGKWITIYTNPGHAYAVIAGLRLDTSGTGGKGPRWHKGGVKRRGFTVRHPPGL